jgi:hypothetical protein
MRRPHDPSLIVNKNDNNMSSWLRRGDIKSNEQYAQYLPIANLIIREYCQLFWKAQPASWEYQYAQLTICALLHSHKAYGLEGLLRLIAQVIGCRNPLALINGPNKELTKHILASFGRS